MPTVPAWRGPEGTRSFSASLRLSELRQCPSLPPTLCPLHPPLHCAQGGFQPEMNRREAALILGLRETAAEERIKEAHRRIMVANHPDSGEKCDMSDRGVHRRNTVVHPPRLGWPLASVIRVTKGVILVTHTTSTWRLKSARPRNILCHVAFERVPPASCTPSPAHKERKKEGFTP